VIVADSGVPSLSDAEQFFVTINPPPIGPAA
jgi:hypothetical protein